MCLYEHILPYTLLHVAYMSLARCYVSCWQHRLGYQWNAKPQNYFMR